MKFETKQLIVPIIALSVYATIFGPLIIYMSSHNEFNYGLIEVLVVALPYFLAVLLGLLTPLPLLKSAARKVYFAILNFVIVTSIINSEILFGSYGAFDGRGLVIDYGSSISIIQILVVGAVACVVAFANINKHIALASLIYIVLNFTINIATFVYNGGVFFKEYNSPDNDQSRIISSNKFVNFNKNKSNYLYIMLDEVYGGSAQEIFQNRPDLAAKFTGFTNYTNTAGVFPTTIMSVPAIITGQLYKEGDDVNEFYKNSFAQSPLLKTLENNSFDYKFHTLSQFCYVLPQGSCSFAGTLGRSSNFIALASNDYFRLLNISLFKSVPDLVKGYVYRDGNWLVREFNKEDKYIDEFNYFVDNLDVSNDQSTFRFFHTTVTHGPVVHNSDCEMSRVNLADTYANYLEQDTCGFVQVARIIDRLKTLGIYDNTYLIISSDHGRRYIPSELAERFDSSGIVSPKEYGSAHATLMVKPLNAHGNYKTSTQAMSLMDTSPLIMRSINNSYSMLYERKFYYYDWSKEYHKWGKKMLPPFQSAYLITGNITDPYSWDLDEKLIQEMVKTPFECDKKISFGSPYYAEGATQERPKSPYYSQGLSGVEAWGRWSDAVKLKILFKIDAGKCSENKLILTLRGFVTNKNPAQQATVFLNKIKIGEVFINLDGQNPREFVFSIPPMLLKQGNLNELSFHIDNPVSPKSVGVSDDSRLLGIGFESMLFQ